MRLIRSVLLRFVTLLSLSTAMRAEDFRPTGDFSNQDSKATGRVGKATERKLVFLDFYNEANNKEYQYLESSVGEAVYHATIRKYTYSRTEQSVWQRYVRANKFKPGDFFDRGKVQIMGEAIPADGIVFGKFTVTHDGIKISARVLSIFSREVIAEAETVLPASKDVTKELRSFSEVLAGRVAELFVPSDRGAIWRSTALPGWGQIYKRRRTAGQIYAGMVGTGFAFSLFSLIMWQTSYSRYRNYTPEHVVTPQGGTELINPADAQAQFDRYASQTQTWQQITYVSVGITLAIHLWQILDAWIFDASHAQIGKRVAFKENSLFIGFGAMPQWFPSQNLYGNSLGQTYVLAIGLRF